MTKATARACTPDSSFVIRRSSFPMNRSRVSPILQPSRRILVIGEMMLDEFIWGKVSRISPEAPVPIVDVIRQTFTPGGAANVARNLHEFVTHVHVLSLIGAGRDAEILRELLEA